ncbi:quinolinate synthase [Desulfobaculum xiamenense]|uniref:Quinolinate synthase n=1 Tax=Desulfobaculum xiamenense TaxID=995050 RepID=A0A846QET5_9BACT|nr:quinolinate synthase NadA [Desulfobaculum xiamenense]NJB66868.1 quinolinate synthase [Desulfobaculum xiamenense]
MSSNHTQIITDIRKQRGSDLVIMAHHYQHERVILHADLKGDSLELARHVPSLKAEYIVFCGVSFMAETAAMLAGEDQKVIIPAPSAGCTMSGMAPAHLLDCVMRRLTEDGASVIPLAYVNTSAAVKGIVGRYGGSVCTSANAKTMLAWALKRGETVLFLPDRNLGNNTADQLGVPANRRMQLDIRGNGSHIDVKSATAARLLLWPGLCSIHERFREGQIDEIRQRDPDALIVVHPECRPGVVRKADAAGSTSFIIKYVANAPAEATIYVGTEINLVERLAKQYRGDKRIRPLVPSSCANMALTTERLLAETLENLENSEPVRVPDDTVHYARIALERMLEACA